MSSSPPSFWVGFFLSWSRALLQSALTGGPNRPRSPGLPSRGRPRRTAKASLRPLTCSPEVLSPYSVTDLGRPVGGGVTSPTGSVFRFSRPLDGLRRPRGFAALFRAAYARGIRSTEVSPPKKPHPFRDRCSLAVGPSADSGRLPRLPSRTFPRGRHPGRPPSSRGQHDTRPGSAFPRPLARSDSVPASPPAEAGDLRARSRSERSAGTIPES